MYGEIVAFYEIAVHFCNFNISPRGRGKPLPYGRRGHFRIAVPLYRIAGLRADEGIGPYGYAVENPFTWC